MGEVYRARDARIGRLVAVKVLPVSVAADRDRARRFEQEARAAGLLNDPNILTIHDVGTARHGDIESPYLVTELLDGVTLREKLREPPIGRHARAVRAARCHHGDRLQIVNRDLSVLSNP